MAYAITDYLMNCRANAAAFLRSSGLILRAKFCASEDMPCGVGLEEKSGTEEFSGIR